MKGIDTLKTRREKKLLDFALKNEHVGRYGKRWFERNEESRRNLRPEIRSTYRLPFCRTDRMSNNPITVMTRALNAHYGN